MSIDVINRVKIYEVDGKETAAIGSPILEVRSASIWDSQVVLSFEGKSLTVVARDLEAAIRNATNKGR